MSAPLPGLPTTALPVTATRTRVPECQATTLGLEQLAPRKRPNPAVLKPYPPYLGKQERETSTKEPDLDVSDPRNSASDMHRGEVMHCTEYGPDAGTRTRRKGSPLIPYWAGYRWRLTSPSCIYASGRDLPLADGAAATADSVCDCTGRALAFDPGQGPVEEGACRDRRAANEIDRVCRSGNPPSRARAVDRGRQRDVTP